HPLGRIRMKRLLASSALSLALAVSALAQSPAPKPPAAGSPPAAPAPSPPAPPASSANPLQKRLQQARHPVGKGDEKGAIQTLEGMRHDPAVTPPVLSLLGGLYLRADRPKEALEVLKPLADAPDADPAVLFNTGRAALALGQQRAGTEYLER